MNRFKSFAYVAALTLTSFIGCGDHNSFPEDTCGPITDPVAVCPSEDLPISSLGLSERIWDIYVDCEDLNAIPITVKEVWPACGLASSGTARIDPVCRYHEEVVAHELGHLLGYSHVSDDECNLMAPKVPPRECNVVRIEECTYGLRE